MFVRILMASTLFLAAIALAEDDETLLRSGEIRSGGFGGPMVKFSPVNGQAGVFVGGRGGWLINSVFSIGGGGYGLANRVTADNPDSVRLELGVGGVILEAVFMPKKLVHGTASLLIGGGSINMHRGRHGNDNDEVENFFALEPELNLEINVLRFFRFCPGVSYRWIVGDSRFLDSDWDISGLSGNLMFKFGKF